MESPVVKNVDKKKKNDGKKIGPGLYSTGDPRKAGLPSDMDFTAFLSNTNFLNVQTIDKLVAEKQSSFFLMYLAWVKSLYGLLHLKKPAIPAARAWSKAIKKKHKK